jgi:hypothetical protein
MASQGLSQEPASNQSSKTKRKNSIGNIHRRSCVCGNDLCYQIWKFWSDIVDDESSGTRRRDKSRAGHVRLPRYNFDAETTDKMFKNKLRIVFYTHLFPKGVTGDSKTTSPRELAESRSGSDNTYEYVAYHHFPPAYLKQDGTGLSAAVVDRETAMELALTDSDIVRVDEHEYRGKYILPPCYKWNEVVRDFLRAGGKLVKGHPCANGGQPVIINQLQSSTTEDKENVAPSANQSTPAAKQALPTVTPRTDPEKRSHTILVNRIKADPEYFAIEYEKLGHDSKMRCL